MVVAGHESEQGALTSQVASKQDNEHSLHSTLLLQLKQVTDSPNGSSNYIRRQYVQAHHYCRKYIVHSNILRLSEWTLNVPPINLLSFSILSTILVVQQSFVCFFYALLYLVYLFIYLRYVCVSWISFCLSFSLSGLLAYVCCACHSPAHNEQWHGIVLLTTVVSTVAACVVVLWWQSLYL